MNYVHTHAHIWITHLYHTMTPWILCDISEFEDLMTTSNDKDIPARNDAGY